MNLTYISLGALTLLLLIILGFCGIDFRKKRVLKTPPRVSFLIPCFNDGATVAKTIESIRESYDMSLSEIIVVEDKSTDNSLEALKRLSKAYGFRLVENKKNLGKAASLNKISHLASNEVLVIVDADVVMNKKALIDMFARLELKNVVAASCPYAPQNTGFLPNMQWIEYNMLSFLQASHNITSTLSLWGGCIAVKKKGFQEVGMFSPNMIVEDMDLALKLNEAGYKVMQSFEPIRTQVPRTLRSWYRQKIRWSSGGAQCIIKHYKKWLQSPLHIIFIILFSALSFIFVVSVIRELVFFDNIIDTFHLVSEGATSLKNLELTAFYYGAILLKNLLSNLYFTAFSVPYALPMIRKVREAYKLLYLFPFALIYYPLFALVSGIGIIKGIIQYRTYEKLERAW